MKELLEIMKIAVIATAVLSFITILISGEIYDHYAKKYEICTETSQEDIRQGEE